jgi:putative inorganic carbon (HCO3(-)) transporter
MRDLLVTLIVLGSLPFILFRPHYGILMWAWLGYMNPHRLSWGFAYHFPFAQVVAICTLAGLLFYRERKALPWSGTLFVWLAFVLWMNVTTLFALDPADAWKEWDRTMKIQLVSFLTLWLMQSRERIHLLVWVIAGSLAFYGVKGGIFAAFTGGANRVFGPEDSFIGDNNAIGLALIMTLPLMRYLQLTLMRSWQRWLALGAILATGVAILSTQSRGAFLAATAMLATLFLKSRKKIWVALSLVVAVPLMLMFMPQAWHDRMASIGNYEQDTSAMGRINAWWFAFHLASDRPLVGGGYGAFDRDLFLRYAPNPTDFHDSHSIYFQVLGEHGFVGLALFLLLLFLALRVGGSVNRELKRHAGRVDLNWARDLASMLQVSLVGYAVGGAFLGLAYFDLFYHLVALLLLVRLEVRKALEVSEAPSPAPDGSQGSALQAPQLPVSPGAAGLSVTRKP